MSEPSVWLGLECSSSSGTLALSSEAGVCVASESFVTGRYNNTEVYAALDKLLKKVDQSGNCLAGVVVGLGPGSYGGVRSSLAIGSGIAIARGVDLYGRGSFEALQERDCLVLGNARRGRLFCLDVEKGIQQQARLFLPDELEMILASTEKPVILAGGPEDFPESVGKLIQGKLSAGLSAEYLLRNFCNLNQEQRWQSMDPAPIYLQGPQITPAKTGHPLLQPRLDRNLLKND